MKRTQLKRTRIKNKMTLAEYKAQLNKGRKSKYGAKSCVVDGITYASGLERTHHNELMLLEKAGLISDLEFQPKPVELTIPARQTMFKPDFRYVENGQVVYTDTKGAETARWRDVKKAWRHSGPAVMRVVKAAGKDRTRTTEEIPAAKE